MQPIKIRIAGDFWDCQIYRGWLYLWTLENEIIIIDWEKVINKITPNRLLKVSMNLAFVNGSHLYENAFETVFNDRDIIKLLKAKFDKLSKIKFSLKLKDIDDCILYRHDSPFPELPNETEISNNAIFAATDIGLLKSNTHTSGLKFGVSSRMEKLWDCPLISIKANLYAQIALSAGSEGLFQYDNRNSDDPYFRNGDNKIGNNLYRLGSTHSQFSNWSFLSIFNSSLIDPSYLSVTAWHEEKQEGYPRFTKQFVGNISEKEIFKSSEDKYLSWGGDDKIYKSSKKGIQIVDFKRTYKDDQENLSQPLEIKIKNWKNQIISAGNAYFGTVAESNDKLYILKSDNEVFIEKGEVTQWKIYPKSKYYQNHLHIIKDDYIDIFSFNHDFFIDQEKKRFGMNHLYSE